MTSNKQTNEEGNMAAQERDGESQQHTSLLVTAGPKLESQKDDYGVAKKTSHISDSSRLTTTCFQPVLLGLMDFSAHMHPQSFDHDDGYIPYPSSPLYGNRNGSFSKNIYLGPVGEYGRC
jgi:hypothetical protein